MRNILVSSIFIAIIVISLVGLLFVYSYTNDTKEKIELATKYCIEESKDELLKSVQVMEDDIDNIESMLSLFVRNTDIEEIAMTLKEIKASAEVETYKTAYIQLQQLQFHVNHLLEREKPNLGNVL